MWSNTTHIVVSELIHIACDRSQLFLAGCLLMQKIYKNREYHFCLDASAKPKQWWLSSCWTATQTPQKAHEKNATNTTGYALALYSECDNRNYDIHTEVGGRQRTRHRFSTSQPAVELQNNQGARTYWDIGCTEGGTNMHGCVGRRFFPTAMLTNADVLLVS